MSNSLVQTSELGNSRKDKSQILKNDYEVFGFTLQLLVRRMVSGKGRSAKEIIGLPANKIRCKGLARDLKKKFGVGGSYKNDFIEVHSKNYERVAKYLESKKISYKKLVDKTDNFL